MDPRVSAFFLALCGGALYIALLSFVLPAGDPNAFADFLLDRNTQLFSYPFTLQNLMWLVFFVGCGELAVRFVSGRRETVQLHKHLLPEDERTVLRQQDLGELYHRVRLSDPQGAFWLQRLLARTMLQFQTSGSIAQVNGLFNSTLELYQHEMDLRYNLLRYLVWLIPTLGFIGTVVGISLALNSIGGTFAEWQPQVDLTELGPKLMAALTHKLGVAFYTTLLALLQTAVLMFAMHVIQGREEGALNAIGQYCLDNLVNRLYEPH